MHRYKQKNNKKNASLSPNGTCYTNKNGSKYATPAE